MQRETLLKSKIVSYSSIVGGGLMLTDETGQARFILSIRGTTEGVTKEESDAISFALDTLINAVGIPVPTRVQPA